MIQSTVAGACCVAFQLIAAYRLQHNLTDVKIVNQIHDAILFMAPLNKIDETKQMIQETMGKIVVPIVGNPLKLAVDIDVMHRWGEKEKE